MANRKWTWEEALLAMNLYVKLPFGKYDRTNPEVIALSKLIGRTPSAIAMRLGNIASLDPIHQQRGIKGLSNSSKIDQEIFDYFHANWEKAILESEELLVQFQLGTPTAKAQAIGDTPDRTHDSQIDWESKTGGEAAKTQLRRIGQPFFRKVVLTHYNNQCAVSRISHDALLVASHIVPWKADEKNRLNPTNGVCLSALYDKAFDRGLMTIMPDGIIRFSQTVLNHQHTDALARFFLPFHEKLIHFPQKYPPNPEFLKFHNTKIFIP